MSLTVNPVQYDDMPRCIKITLILLTTRPVHEPNEADNLTKGCSTKPAKRSQGLDVAFRLVRYKHRAIERIVVFGASLVKGLRYRLKVSCTRAKGLFLALDGMHFRGESSGISRIPPLEHHLRYYLKRHFTYRLHKPHQCQLYLQNLPHVLGCVVEQLGKGVWFERP
jgi:hypothetical protein